MFTCRGINKKKKEKKRTQYIPNILQIQIYCKNHKKTARFILLARICSEIYNFIEADYNFHYFNGGTVLIHANRRYNNIV